MMYKFKLQQLFRCLLMPIVLVLLSVATAAAQNLKVAVAANLQPVMKALKEDFKERTGITAEPISGPSGGLATQIRNGAPFDVFMSADMEFPEQLAKDGLAVKAPVEYARGVLVICSRHQLGADAWPALLTGGAVKKIAIGNPRIAPYGKAAEEVLKHERIFDRVKGKLVIGESISQVNNYIVADAVQAAFTTMSFVKEQQNKLKLQVWQPAQSTYAPIRQGIIVLKRTTNRTAANKFYQYILSAPARKIFLKYGYQVK